MARPKVLSANKRTIKFTLQLTPAEKLRIVQLAQSTGKAPAILARDKIFKGRFPLPRAARLDLHTYTELKRIGVNLNQLSRKANAGIIPMELFTVLYQLEQRLDTIVARLVYDRQSEDR
jgi:hypothetical protein